jgi:hypothetical protein
MRTAPIGELAGNLAAAGFQLAEFISCLAASYGCLGDDNVND